MTSSKIISHAVVLLLGVIIGVTLSSFTKDTPLVSSKKLTPKVENIASESIDTPLTEIKKQPIAITEKNQSGTNISDSVQVIATLPTKTPSSVSSDKEETNQSTTSSTKFSDATGQVNFLPSTGVGSLCFSTPDELSLQLTLFAEKMEKDSLWYDSQNPKELKDCSGIFHRVARFVNSKCNSYDYPKPSTARDSRSLARWYKKKRNLIVIDDPLEKRNLIRPGAVMFFGKSGQQYSQLTTEKVIANYPNHIIQHIGVVTEVKYDLKGNVEGYTMLHGRRKGVTAQRSHYHQIKPPRLGYPILGNWNQQWVAMAYITAEKEAS